MQFDQLIEYNMRNLFVEKLYTKYGGQTISRLYNIEIEHISEAMVRSFILFVFIVCKVQGYRNMLKLSCRPFAFTSYKDFFKKQKEVWNQSPCPIFCMVFQEKYLSYYILLTDQIPLSGCFYIIGYWIICVLQLFVNQIVTS